MKLGEKIKQRRRQLNLSQEKLAEQISVHSNTIRKWEKGVSSPSATELQMLAEALNTSTSFLYGENNPTSFVKNSAYQDKTEIQDSIPTMAYWGSLVDNASRKRKKSPSHYKPCKNCSRYIRERHQYRERTT